jgi:hypothetical protein
VTVALTSDQTNVITYQQSYHCNIVYVFGLPEGGNLLLKHVEALVYVYKFCAFVGMYK